MVPNLPFATLEDDVLFTFGDVDDAGAQISHKLRYPIVTLRRLSKQLGVPMLGKRGTLLDIDETNLPELVFAGLCDPETGEAPSRFPDHPERGLVTIDQILALPSSALKYLSTTFVTAYTQSRPEKKIEDAVDGLRKAIAELPTTATKN